MYCVHRPVLEGRFVGRRHLLRVEVLLKKFPKLPLFIIENSIPTEGHKPRSDGYLREDHLRDIVYWLEKAKADGMNVSGYNYWSLTDNYEWGSYTPRFGLYTVDVKTDPKLGRAARRRPSRRIATSSPTSGVPDDYMPSRPPTFCSLVDGPVSRLRGLVGVEFRTLRGLVDLDMFEHMFEDE